MGTKSRLKAQMRIVATALCRHEEGLTYGGIIAETTIMAKRAYDAIEQSHEGDLAGLRGRDRGRAIRRFAGNPWVVRPVKGDQLEEVLARLLELRLVRIEPKRGPGTPDARYIDVSWDPVRIAWAYAVLISEGAPVRMRAWSTGPLRVPSYIEATGGPVG